MLPIQRDIASTLSLICIVVLVSQVGAATYTGSITVGNGLTAMEDWINPATTLSWAVTNEDPDPTLAASFVWKYSYTLIVPAKSPSHAIFEASNGENPFTSDNIAKITGATDMEIQEYYPTGGQGANPLMPSAVYGIKLEGWDELTTLNLSFYSDRDPVWGDFYAKDGKSSGNPVVLYNTGFSAADPVAPAGNDSHEDHLLVPDTVPEPSLLSLPGFASLALLRRKRR